MVFQYNDEALYQSAYLSLPKRMKDKMIHFDKPHSLSGDHLQGIYLFYFISTHSLSPLFVLCLWSIFPFTVAAHVCVYLVDSS